MARQVSVRYEYEVAGTPYTSSNISFESQLAGNKRRAIEAIVARYPEGQRVTVYYNPERPKTAVLERSANPPSYNSLLIFGSGFLLAGVAMFVLAFVNKVRKRISKRRDAADGSGRRST